MEAEVRAILSEVLAASDQATPGGLGTRIHARFAALGGLELDLPARTELASTPSIPFDYTDN
jgi:plasmid stability protein